MERSADDNDIGHLDHAQVRVRGGDNLAVDRFPHDDRVAVAAHDSHVGTGFLEGERE